ncbi:MAG: S-adenosylmethionine:tRNA ribosyltransferase-isomerase [Ferroplasma sp.]|uniref:S-adenosylmethionine:tRNA ribosyltransferase-isomerase n=1 Tax=Ferroplasma sp. TaxID=2591003 RepID=UPI002814BC34|nr:S-adenosylmethionine:tRNA ribosyltransferase-isomerase [Ferroplasma sp.]WMT50813.1 MAG: S-adenosylmethionine:tRNA ribosyltransferase-isomerase [Ferroplasma sp.]
MNGMKNIFEMSSVRFGIPNEYNGLGREQVRLLSINPVSGKYGRTKFTGITAMIHPGDALVFNSSITVPASFRLYSPDLKKYATVNIGYRKNGYIAEFRGIDNEVENGMRFLFPDMEYIDAGEQLERFPRYRNINVSDNFNLEMEEKSAGRYIKYDNNMPDFPEWVYRNVYASVPGSVEYPSASRPFTGDIVKELKRNGVHIVCITLHCNLGSMDATEFAGKDRLLPEYYSVSGESALALNRVKEQGGRIIAVGTTAVRALATVYDGSFHSGSGYTEIFINRSTETGVDGLVTGMHDPTTSHIKLLESFVDIGILESAYETAIDSGFTWDEFGDSTLILP